MTTFTLIAAYGADGVIGVNNTLPWNIPADMKMFKALTIGCPVIMGRATWESIPEKWRPLPKRLNVIVSSTLSASDVQPGAVVIPELSHRCFELFAGSKRVFVIGGGTVYDTCIERDLIDEAYLTKVDYELPPGTENVTRFNPAPIVDHWFAPQTTVLSEAPRAVLTHYIKPLD